MLKMNRVLLSVILSFLPFFSNSLDQASFYGGSYILVPLKEAKATTDIRLKFRTQLPNGLLLLAAGEPDYCILYLQAGSLKVRINLGAGESELSSPHGLILNDLLWHEVVIKRKDANISMIIDNVHSVKKHLTGEFFELNIHFGVFIGGKGDFSELFLGLLESFRGCISELKYNGLYLLEQARKRQGQVHVQSVTWNCAAEFEMDVDKEISFVEEGAYVIVSHVPIRTGLKYQMEFKTILEQCIFLYSTGISTKSDLLLLALEIWKGRLKLTMKYNNVHLNVTSDIIVSDGRWHHVLIQIGSAAELTVDAKTASSYLTRLGRNRHLEFPDVFSIGGIENEKRARALAKGFKTSDANFKGCLKNVIIDDFKVGLSNVKATEGIRPGCIWNYPCVNNPCSKHSKCLQKGLDSFQCKCDGIMCVNLNYTKEYKVFSNSNLATDLELLSVKALQVMEGDNELITTANLHLIFDYHKYGIRDSGIMFQVVQPPLHGNIFVDIWPRKDNSFTLLDLSRDKVRYVHDGSENVKDRIVMDLELSVIDSFILPAYLQGKNRFTLPIIITLVNDPPIFEISTSSVLRIAQGTEEYLTKELLLAKDADTPAKDLIYTVLPQDAKKVGHLERIDQPSIPITSFSQEEINNNKIKFVHHGGSDVSSNIALQVSDGIENSKVAFLRVSAFAQHLRLQNNTGVVLVHDSSVLITPYNLSLISNVKKDLPNLKYTIVTSPKYGVVEVEKHDKWEICQSFLNHELEQYRVRYRHTSGTPNHDEFKFFASLKFVNSTTYIFRMTFTKLNLIKYHQKHVFLNTTEIILSNRDLLYKTEPLWTNPSLIIYQILKAPIFGYLVLNSIDKMQVGNSFTQEDINSGEIRYRLHRKSYSNITDNIILTVSALGGDYLTANLTFIYYVNSELLSKVQAFIKPLKVEEGSKVNITTSNFNLTINGVTDYTVNITEKPKHGLIQVTNKISNPNKSSDYFTLKEMLKGAVTYNHDDSESQSDSFTFLALSNEEENAQYTGKVNINIFLKNDNTLVRNVDAIFYVITNGKKLLTGKDLSYSDADIDSKPSNIVYSCRDIPNGVLYKVNSSNEPILEFTQEDLNNEAILFKHKGESYGKIKFWVSDGQFNVNGHLEVQASNPFIKIVKPKKIVLEQGKSIYITSEELYVVTNLNTKPYHIIYEVVQKPQNGKIVLAINKQEVKQFTQHEVNMAQVMYIHDGNSISFDEMKLKVHCQETSNVVTLTFRILPSSYWKPLKIVANHTLYVEESTSIPIIRENLEIAQHQVPSKVIIYYVKEPPQFGYLDIENDKKESSENIKEFSQEAINLNKIRYVQSSANETHDRIVFNVTNGIVWLPDVILNVIVVPEHLYLASVPLQVFEGSEATLSPTNLFVLTEYYKNKVSDYLIIRPPKYGCLKKNNQCNSSTNFSQKELEKGFIKYSHNNTENFEDEITVIAIAGQKRSIPTTVTFNITPINDQIPILVNNTGLTMWEGGLATITKQMLSATDNDKPKETLTYTLTGCWWGNVTLNTNSKHSIQSFTQDDIDADRVMFRHTNGSEAKFLFTVSDGLHVTKERSFVITTKPVKLILNKLSNLHVFPLHRSFITANDLLSTASDPNRIIAYEVISSPNLGRLMMETEIPGNFKIVQYFTQEYINASKIFYEHTHPFAGLYANDYFIFNVHAHLTNSIHNKKMSIDISVSSGGLDTYINVPKLEVIEGGLISIQLNLSEVVSFLESHTGLKAPIIHLSASQPAHGFIILSENMNTTVFTQSQIESGQIKYQHDHSDSHNDSVTFTLFFIPGYITLCNVTVHIKIIPVNDQPFELITTAPKITVVEGENYTITRNDLLTEDADTDPVDLKYVIITNLTQGKLFQVHDNGDVKDVSVTNTFSQADIDGNRIVYVHSGSPQPTAFYFRVWDGKFKPIYTLFNIQVIPVIINVTSGIPIYLQQGSNVALLSVDQFNIQTNADVHRVHFRLTKTPNHGLVYVRDMAANNFTYKDLQEKSVMYMQTDMSSANDSFRIFAGISSSENKSVGSVVEIIMKVQPLMQIGNLSVVSGSKIKLTLNILDATPLAKLTSSNPKYTLIKKAIHGQIRKIIRSSGEKRNVVDNTVTVFTHEEIKSGLIYYVAPLVKANWINWKEYDERLVFLLSTSIFQPAIGEIRFKIMRTSLDKSNPNSVLTEPQDPSGHEGGEMHMTSRHINSDYFLVLTVITGIIITGITVIVIIKCRHFHCVDKNQNKNNAQCMQNVQLQLPKPPTSTSATASDHHHHHHFSSSTSSPYTKRYVADNNISVSVPQCKVTLLRPLDSLTNSELDVHVRYPYGTSDDQTGLEDWSSYDTSEPTYSTTHNTNLMLRKNQYWV